MESDTFRCTRQYAGGVGGGGAALKSAESATTELADQK